MQHCDIIHKESSVETCSDLIESSTEPLVEILFPDTDSTKYWLADDKSFRKKADKGDAEASDTAGVAIDEASFADVKRIVDNIPKEEHHFFYNGGTFKNSPYVLYRNVAYVPHVRGKIGAFIEVYAFDDAPDIGIVVIAAEPAARGKGLTDKLIKNAIKTLSTMGIHTLYWRCDADNIASYKLAERNGFILNDKKTTKEQYVFTRDISNGINVIIDETTINSREDYVEYNISLWEANTSHNILYITGHSGSGKSTLGMKLANENNALYISLDHFTSAWRKGSVYLQNRIGDQKWPEAKLLAEYFADSRNFPKPKNVIQFDGPLNKIPRELIGASYKKFITWIRETLTVYPKNKLLYIIEGIHIFEFESAETYKNEPLIIMSANSAVSLMRREKRGINKAKKSGITGIELVTGTIKDSVDFAIPMYANAAPMINKFRQDMNKLTESFEQTGYQHLWDYDGNRSKENIIMYLNSVDDMKDEPLDEILLPNEINEAVADTHSLDREQKADVAKKYGLKNVGSSHEAEEEDRKREEAKKKEREEHERIKALEKKAKERNNNLKKARKAKKRKAFKRKLISKLPGIVHESVDTGDAEYLEHPETDHSELWGDRIQFFEPKERFENPKAIDEIESIQESYTFEMAEHIQFFDRMNESTHQDTKLYPVYIMLMHSGTVLANTIKKMTNSQFSHCSISFDSSMTQMYSFGRKFDMNPFIGGFKKEDIRSEFFKNKQIPYALYVVPCTQDQIAAMKKRLDYFVKNATKFRYDFTGLLKNYFGIADNPEYKWFCSRFVADILNAGRPSPEPYIVEPSLMKPEDFRYTTFAQYVTGGYLCNYHQKFVDNVTKRILRTEMMKRQKINKIEDQFNEAAYGLDRDNPWAIDVLNYQLTIMDESVIDTFLQYLQSFKIRFSKNGDILVTRREYDHLDTHFRNSLKMIKAHEKAGNINGVKDELCKIYYMIDLINKYYLRDDVKNMRPNTKDVRKDMLDLRSVMLNVFQQHLKYVTTRDPRWNFNTYYDNSKYGKNVTIPQKVITSVGKAIVTVLK